MTHNTRLLRDLAIRGLNSILRLLAPMALCCGGCHAATVSSTYARATVQSYIQGIPIGHSSEGSGLQTASAAGCLFLDGPCTYMSAAAEADYGALHGSASADQSFGWGGGGVAYAEFTDSIAFLASRGGLLPDTVILRFTAGLDDTLASTNGGASAVFQVNSIIFIDDESGSPRVGNTSIDIQVSTSQAYFIDARLSVGCTAYSSGQVPDLEHAGCLANASDTATLHIDMVTPGVTYTTDSGQTYFTADAAPEPSTLWTAGGFLTCLALVGRKILLRRAAQAGVPGGRLQNR
jgi:hypothetical protein